MNPSNPENPLRKVVHDLRNPMAVICNVLDLLQLDELSPRNQTRVASARRSATTVLDMLSSLLGDDQVIQAAPAPKVVARVSAEAPHVKPNNGCKVLLVDDETENRELMSGLLEERGYTVSTAEHGARAVSLLEAGLDPDLILTDLQMPVMGGWEFCEALKRSPAWRSIPVVVLCAMSSEQRGQLQVEGSFEKGGDLPTLLNRIAELCGA